MFLKSIFRASLGRQRKPKITCFDISRVYENGRMDGLNHVYSRIIRDSQCCLTAAVCNKTSACSLFVTVVCGKTCAKLYLWICDMYYYSCYCALSVINKLRRSHFVNRQSPALSSRPSIFGVCYDYLPQWTAADHKGQQPAATNHNPNTNPNPYHNSSPNLTLTVVVIVTLTLNPNPNH